MKRTRSEIGRKLDESESGLGFLDRFLYVSAGSRDNERP
jgi:hypothetical protein